MPQQITQVDRYEPDYTQECEVCGANHVVTAIKDNKVVYKSTMCGVCTWGEAEMADPEEWNK